MWKDYFGPKANIFGFDIEPRCKDLEEENIKIFIGSHSDREFLREVKGSYSADSIPYFDSILVVDAVYSCLRPDPEIISSRISLL